MRPGVLVTVGALTAFAVQLVALPDLWQPPPGRLSAWLLLEAVVAVGIGVVATRRRPAAVAVLAGWLLQILFFVVVTPKDENHDLWAVGLFVLAALGGVAVGLALVAHAVTRHVRPRRG